MRLWLILLLLLLIGCSEQQEKEGLETVTGQHITELQQTACDAADDAGTCDTKLASLGFITKEDCCEKFEKCC